MTPIRCRCGRLLFEAEGLGSTVRIKCRCRRMVTREADGRVTWAEEQAEPAAADARERRTA